MRRLALSTLVALVLAALCGANAFAHAYLVQSTPGDGDLLKQAPPAVELVFNEPVDVTAAAHVDPQGLVTQLGKPQGVGARLVLPMPAGLGQGSHLVSYRVTSEDGHSVSGSLVFSVGRASGGDAGAGHDSTVVLSALSVPLVATRFLLLASLLFGVGASLFAAFLAPLGKWRGAALAVLALGALGAVVAIGLQGADAHGQGLAALNDRANWRSGLRLPQGMGSLLALMAVACAMLALLLRARAARILALAGLVFLALGLTFTSHARLWRPEAFMQGAVTLHVMAAIAWAGSLAPLLWASWRDDFPLTLKRFSMLAAPVYGLLLASGATLAATQLLAPRGLLDTAWGLVLLVKLGLVLVVSLLALLNRYRFTTPALAGDGAATLGLRRSIRLEAGAALLILAVASFWRLTPPPTSLGVPDERAFQIHVHGVEAMASMTIRPARVGPVQIRIEPKGADLSPLRVQQVDLYLSPDAPGLAPIHRQARLTSDANLWDVEGVTIPAPGLWRLRIDLLIDDFSRNSLDAVISVRP